MDIRTLPLDLTTLSLVSVGNVSAGFKRRGKYKCPLPAWRTCFSLHFNTGVSYDFEVRV